MNSPTLEDYIWLARWLPSDEASSCLKSAKLDVGGLAARIGALRAELVRQQVALQPRVRLKFGGLPEPLCFAPVLLEQATSYELAQYKAQRLAAPPDARVWDLCCGAGGDLFGLAKRHPRTIGVDRDALACELARANLRVLQLRADVLQRDALQVDVEAKDFVHADPDRRSRGRSVSPDQFAPPLAHLEPTLRRARRAAVKLAPATELDQRWIALVEREWLGSRRETKQQVAWFGCDDVALGKRRATVIRDGRVDSLLQQDETAAVCFSELETYLWEPHSAVRAAGLTDELAVQRKACRLSSDSPYLTSPYPSPDQLAATFEVIDEMGWNPRRCKRRLREFAPSAVEVKTRGLGLDANELAGQFGGGDGPPLVLLIHRHGKRLRAIIARRPALEPDEAP